MHPRSRALAALALLLAPLVVACSETGGRDPVGTGTIITQPTTRPTLPQEYRPTGRTAAGDVSVHLFEWKWTDVATECETRLGPQGFRAVQLSPPQEHITGPQWWTRYQPVSYSVARSRSGTGAEFAAMVSRCRAAGVDIYVDAVINHMTAGSGTGTNGTAYTKYDYPRLYSPGDFHLPCGITDYSNAANVQDCELVGLADLRTGAPSVRRTIADYLLSLSRMGVAGYRIDAAKHIQPVQLDSIVDLVNATLAAEGLPQPYWFGEVIDYGGEAVSRFDYFGLGFSTGGAADITEFKFRGTGDKFLKLNGQRLAQLDPMGAAGSRFSQAAWGLIPSDKAVVFLENHDTQRSDGIGYRDGAAFRLANVWMLAQPYGYPSVLSGYALDRSTQAGRDRGPPAQSVADAGCAARLETATVGQWTCEHRDPHVAAMVGFRRRVAGTDVNRWWTNGADAIAFSRGDRGFVAINAEPAATAVAVPTGLPAGSYCDVLTGGVAAGGGCAGTTVVVDAGGAVQLVLAANTAVAVHAGSRP